MSITALVVDDQNSWGLLLQRLLKKEGFQTSYAAGSQTAEKILKQKAFDLAIIDVRLVDEEPGNVEGLKLVQTLKSYYPNTKIVVITGYPEDVRGDLTGVEFIHKVPEGSTFNNKAFKDLVKKLVNK